MELAAAAVAPADVVGKSALAAVDVVVFSVVVVNGYGHSRSRCRCRCRYRYYFAVAVDNAPSPLDTHDIVHAEWKASGA
jgi:hypothetical protein